MSTILIMLGLGALVVALWGLVRGHVAWAHIGDRKRAAQVAAGSFVAMVVGAAIAPVPTTVASAPTPTVTVTVTAPTPTPSPTPTVTPTPTPEPTAAPAPAEIVGLINADAAQAATKAPVAQAAATKAPTSQAPKPAATKAPAPKAAAPKAPAKKSAYYKNCTAAWNAGVAPLHRGDPGYAAHLDGDNDGVACEKRPR